MLGCFDNFFFLLDQLEVVAMGQVRVSKNFCIYWDFCVPTYFEIPCLIPGFSCTYFPSPFLYNFLLLHCLSFFFSSLSPCVLLGLSSAHLAFLFIFLSFFCFTDSLLGNLGVCFFGIHAWVVFVLYLTTYMAGFGFWVGGDDCRCASFFRSPFFISILSFHFSLHFYDKINEKRRGLYCVGEGLFRFDFRWWLLLDCVIIDISFPRFRVC